MLVRFKVMMGLGKILAQTKWICRLGRTFAVWDRHQYPKVKQKKESFSLEKVSVSVRERNDCANALVALSDWFCRDECGRDYGDRIMVASTEKFQGQERLVMLISTVRSSTDEDGEWSRKLGFLINPQRFNVSVTRARSLLIVIGDPHLLTRDKCWGDYLEFAISKQAYVGCQYEAKSRRNERRQEAKGE